MKTHAKVVVIGGGVVGASVLYHLTKAGWTDVLLLERAELTAGSTWHAAGGMHTVNGDPNVAKLQQYTIELYKEIEELSGQSCGVHLTGGVMLAGTAERLDWLKMTKRPRPLSRHGPRTRSRPAEAKAALPAHGREDISWAPSTTRSRATSTPTASPTPMRSRPRSRVPRSSVSAGWSTCKPRPDGSWDVVTEKGDVHAEHVVNAGGLWAREVGRMVGLELPVLAMEHHYLITEDMPELVGQKEQLHCIDYEGEIYMRQERGGMLMGTYEQQRQALVGARHAVGLRPEPAARRPRPHLGEPRGRLRAFPGHRHGGAEEGGQRPLHLHARRQSADRAGEGPATTSGSPAASWRASARAAASAWRLANWMVEGDPGFDVWAMDVARYGDWTTMAYTNAKVRENYSRRFRIRFPNEELAGRAAAANDARLRRAESRGRLLRRILRARTSALVRPPGDEARRADHLPPLRGARSRRRRVPRRPRRRGPDRDLELRQVRRHGPEGGRLPVARHGEPATRARPHGALAHVERERQADRRFHGRPVGGRPLLPGRHAGGRDLLPALVRPAQACGRVASWCAPARPSMSVSRSRDRRAAHCSRVS